MTQETPIKTKLMLVEVHDTDADHEVGGQDLPFLVTAKVEGSMKEAEEAIYASKLEAFNVQPSNRLGLPDHIEFCTFAFCKEIDQFFGVTRPKTKDEELYEKYSRSTYVQTVAELRAAIADLPDDFQIIHSGESENRVGICVLTMEWAFKIPGDAQYGYPCWSLRLFGPDPSTWKKIVEKNREQPCHS